MHWIKSIIFFPDFVFQAKKIKVSDCSFLSWEAQTQSYCNCLCGLNKKACYISRNSPVCRPLADTLQPNTGRPRCCRHIWNRGWVSTLHRLCTQSPARRKTLTTQINTEWVNRGKRCQVMSWLLESTVCPQTHWFTARGEKKKSLISC